jgi:hypothetical protein
MLLPAAARAQGGTPLWTNYHKGHPIALAVDANGNAFATGYYYYDGDADYATFACSSAGTPLWTNYYAGPAYWDFDRAVEVGTNGNVYVTGYSTEPGRTVPIDSATIAYSSAGEQLWINHIAAFGSPQMAVDINGNVAVACSGQGWLTTKYTSEGSLLWSSPYEYPADSSDWLTGLEVDATGNVYVSGWSQFGPGGLSIVCLTIKYSSAGMPLWTNRYQGISIGRDGGAVAVDGSGKLYVTGSVANGVHNDYATIAYSSEMVPLWTNRYDGPGNGEDKAYAIALDAAGNVLVTGTSVGRGTFDYRTAVTIKYSSTGVPLWTNRFNGSAGFEDYLNYPDDFFAVDGSGNAFVTRISTGDGNVTIAYSSAGVPLWTNKFDGVPSSLALDATGNVYVAGVYVGVGGFVSLVKYAAVGPSLSISRIGGQVRIAWATSASGWALRRAAAAAGPYNDPGLSVATEGSESVAYDNLGAGAAFYRLEKSP